MYNTFSSFQIKKKKEKKKEQKIAYSLVPIQFL